MKDLIYKIYSVYLYSNQLEHPYLILHNDNTNSGIAKWLSGALNKIYDIKDKEERVLKSIDIIKEAIDCSRYLSNNTKLIDNKEYLTTLKVKDTVDPRYSIYNIFWNETKSGINIMDYKYCSIYNPGDTSISEYRIFEEKENRTIQLRNRKLQKQSE